MELYSEISSFTIKSFINSLGKLNEYYAHGLWQLWEEMGCDQGSIGVLRPKAIRGYDGGREQSQNNLLIGSTTITSNWAHYLQNGCESLWSPRLTWPGQLERRCGPFWRDLRRRRRGSPWGRPIPISSLTFRLTRNKKTCSLKSTIIDLLDELGIEPRSQFERTIVCESDESFLPLSEEQLTRVVAVRDGLFKEKSKKIQEAEAMRTFIRDVSKKTPIGSQSRGKFFERVFRDILKMTDVK
ncbi:Uncharacterized protein FKW44_010580 [Caligus rogercresseyi]|uniref:Uncharacterized protein n=1 Tax=Caligus rogercresseyi TaxID=217165 RepID=A0A7T8K862_CALRO|nr:Uncharacterized protein FKW44_010580 [Caligus rogercresseyi]